MFVVDVGGGLLMVLIVFLVVAGFVACDRCCCLCWCADIGIRAVGFVVGFVVACVCYKCKLLW